MNHYADGDRAISGGTVQTFNNGVLTYGQEWRFAVENPMGAVRTTQRQKWVDPNYKRYEAYKRAVRLVANTAGVPAAIDAEYRAQVEMFFTFPCEVHADIDNLGKALLDALWKQDRRVIKLWAEIGIAPLSKPMANVVVRFVRGK